jgi:hypothetical protein
MAHATARPSRLWLEWFEQAMTQRMSTLSCGSANTCYATSAWSATVA